MGHLLLRRFRQAAALLMFAIGQSGIIQMKGDASVSSKAKKRLLLKEDLRKKVKFCWNIEKYKTRKNFWNSEILMYIDGKGFQYKQNPLGYPLANLTDGCPRQNVNLSLRAIKEIGALVFKISPPSLSLNSTENVLNFVL